MLFEVFLKRYSAYFLLGPFTVYLSKLSRDYKYLGKTSNDFQSFFLTKRLSSVHIKCDHYCEMRKKKYLDEEVEFFIRRR